MAVNKVIFGSVTLIDTSEVTVTPGRMFEGDTALGADGELQTGTFTIAGELAEQDALLTELEAALEGKAAPPQAVSANVNVTITGKYFSSMSAFYSVFEDGQTVQKIYTNESAPPYSITAQCGSYLYLVPDYLSAIQATNATVTAHKTGASAGAIVLLPDDDTLEVTIHIVGD